MTTHQSTIWYIAGGIVIALLAGVGIGAGLWRHTAPPPAGTTAAPTTPPPDEGIRARAPRTVTLPPEMVERAGIRTVTAETAVTAGGLRIPAVVQPDAYREVVVSALVGGEITQVDAVSGAPVRRGQRLARIFSPELAAAHTEVVALTAELEAHRRNLDRTTRLTDIGAASRQELEMVQAEHERLVATLNSAHARLRLLSGQSDTTAVGDAFADVVSPLTGVLTRRDANPGLNVTPGMPLFTVVDLSRVWLIAAVPERDIGHVAVGAPVTVTSATFPDMAIEAQVAYIDPAIDAETRTARVRVEVPNPDSRLRLGMFVDVTLAVPAEDGAVVIPRAAVQTIDGQEVVYMPDPETAGRFVEREVRLGQATGEAVHVIEGLEAGDEVVSVGSFFLRAERQRLGPQQAGSSAAAPVVPPGRDVRIEITERGFEPDRIEVERGRPARLTFVRRTDATCATEIVVPAIGVTRMLPRDEPVTIEFTPTATGQLTLACGMDMITARIVVQ